MDTEEKIEHEFLKRPKNPFQTPEGYFDTLEDRIMLGIKLSEKPTPKSSRIIHFLKPALGLVASLSLVYLLVYYPGNHSLLKNGSKTVQTDTSNSDVPEAYSLSFLSLDENTLLNTITSDETNGSSQLSSDAVLAYLSTGTNDLELYSEIQN